MFSYRSDNGAWKENAFMFPFDQGCSATRKHNPNYFRLVYKLDPLANGTCVVPAVSVP